MFGIFSRKYSFLESGLPEIVEDRHSHIMYGVDDGVRTKDEADELISFLASIGVETLWLTPHIMEDIPNTGAALRERFAEMEELSTGRIRLCLAAEYMLDNLFARRLQEGDLLTMDGNMVLVETSTWEPPYGMDDILEDIKSAGCWPLLAHPERYRYMEMKDYRSLVDRGVRLQMNLPSIMGAYGEHARKRAKKLLSEGLYSYVGSDCHSLRSLRRIYSNKILDKKDIEAISGLMSRNKEI